MMAKPIVLCVLAALLAMPLAAPADAPAPASQPVVLKSDFWLSRPEALAQKMVDEQLADRQKDPLKYVAGDMTIIHGDLSADRTGKPVQVKQERVVKQLDTLIAMLEKQCKGGGAGGSRNPSRPLARSVIAGGPGGQGEMINADDQTKQWGNLPPRQREAIMQSQTEGFPQGYEAILQSYYRRLAQEQTADDAGSEAAAPAGAPGQ
jgi:hypothetical protein